LFVLPLAFIAPELTSPIGSMRGDCVENVGEGMNALAFVEFIVVVTCVAEGIAITYPTCSFNCLDP
jgi:hypothetical protein